MDGERTTRKGSRIVDFSLGIGLLAVFGAVLVALAFGSTSLAGIVGADLVIAVALGALVFTIGTKEGMAFGAGLAVLFGIAGLYFLMMAPARRPGVLALLVAVAALGAHPWKLVARRMPV